MKTSLGIPITTEQLVWTAFKIFNNQDKVQEEQNITPGNKYLIC